MIVIQLKGGLGNQMFQYAFGRALSIKHNVQLGLDSSQYYYNETDPPRSYGLQIFSLDPSLKLVNNENLHRRSILQRISNRLSNSFKLPNIFPGNIIYESQYHDEIEKIDQKMFIGYWQSEKYFKNVESMIRADFTFTPKALKSMSDLIQSITANNSISIHVRRGDYVGNTTHPVCSLKFYQDSVHFCNSQVQNPLYFIFSDDISWAKENLMIEGKHHYISANRGKNDYVDLFLMSKCKHNIIANSSFSWWGGWLNDYHEKIVVAPRKWFNSDELNNEHSDLLPDTWIRI
jgi:hypothetical protein